MIQVFVYFFSSTILSPIYEVPRSLAAELTFAHVNVSPITNKILYQATGKVRENWF
jgi:hypothetical protein